MSVIDIIIERKGWFLGLVEQHLILAGVSILLAGVIGLLLGILVYEKKSLAKVVLGITNMLYTIPDIAMFGFLIPLTGIGNKTAIVALTIYALLPMVRNTYTGLDQVDPDIVEAAIGMGSTKRQLLLKIQLPLAFPVILTGIRNMSVMTISIAGIASFIGAGGLGQAIYRGIATNNQELMLAGSIIIAAIAIILDLLFGMWEQGVNNHRKFKRGVVLVLLLLVFLAAVIHLNAGRTGKQITVGYDNTAEEAVIANILIDLIEEETDITVEELGDLSGGETVLLPAALEGEIDIYPEYTGTAWLTILKHTEIPDQETLNAQLNSEYKEQYDLEWLGMYGFNDSYGLAVSNEAAEKYGLKTYSDLAEVSENLTFGAEPGFYERADGYEDLCKSYGFKFKKHSDITFSLKYDAIQENKVDVITVFTTDGRLSSADVTVLEDDLEYFPKYLCGNVIRSETLEKYPELRSVLEQTNDLISDQDMSMLNKKVEIDGKEPAAVAREFLKNKGLLP